MKPAARSELVGFSTIRRWLIVPIVTLGMTLVGAAAAPVNADTTEFEITGTLFVQGNNLCAGPCVQGLSFALTAEWLPFVPGYGDDPTWTHRFVVHASSNVISAGPLGTFTTPGATFLHFNDLTDPFVYIPFVNATSGTTPIDSIELQIKSLWWTSTPWVAPTFDEVLAQLFGCHTPACEAGFDNGQTGPATVTVRKVPEPLPLLLVALGMAVICVTRFISPPVQRRRSMRSAKMFTRSFLLITLLVVPQSATAARPLFVGDGTPASCTEAALRYVLAVAGGSGGGTIRFNCGDVSTTIIITDTLILPHDTTIDGGGDITLLGEIPKALMLVEEGSAVALKGLTVTNPTKALFAGPAALHNKGTLIITHSAFSNNRGGPISNEGTLTVRGSSFLANGRSPAVGWGGIVNDGVLRVTDTVFAHNTGQSGCAIVNSGHATIVDSTFADNSDVTTGAAIGNGGVLTVHNSYFARNSAGHGGGAIINGGTATFTNSTFVENRMEPAGSGGAIVNTGTLSVRDSVFSSNGSNLENGHTTGGAVANFGMLDVHGSTFSGNMASVGGAFSNSAGTLVIDNSNITENAAVQGRSGGTGGGISNQGSLTVRNSLITGNTAFLDGGGIYSCCGGTVRLDNTRVFGNTPNDVVQ